MVTKEERIESLERALATALHEWVAWMEWADQAGCEYGQDELERFRECNRVLKGEG